jgi:sugar (pentulose or hexulose) kinase
MALLGIDLGTSSVKVIVLDTQGHMLSMSNAGYSDRSFLRSRHGHSYL